MGIVDPDAVHAAYPPRSEVEVKTEGATNGPQIGVGGAVTLDRATMGFIYPPKAVQIPSCGRIVHYVLPPRSDLRPHIAGEHRPAIVIQASGDPPHAACCLNVFLRGHNDKEDYKGEVLYVGSVSEDQTTQAPGTWHWPEYVPAVFD